MNAHRSARARAGFRIALYVLVGVLFAIGTALAVGEFRWRGITRARLARLDALRQAPEPASYSEAELEGLPAPVQRYFRAALRDGQPIIARARLTQRGEILLGEAEDGWRPFTATQTFSPRPPGFLWDARGQAAPGMSVYVHDAYIGGEGVLQGALLGLVTVVDMSGTPEVAEGELMRYLAEGVWIPTALLPSQDVRWEPMDDERARATLVDGETSVSLVFTFGADGLVSSVFADARPRDVGGETVPTPWEGRFGDYVERNGMRIPTSGEVAWQPEGRRLPYWRGHIIEVAYEYAR